jgi:hypothetical protein
LRLTDTVTHAAFSTNVIVDIPGTVGTNTAYVGVTGADGGISSTQVISKFQFASLTALSAEQTGPANIVVTWPDSAGGLELQQASATGSAWVAVSNPIISDEAGHFEADISPQAGYTLYRLATP